METMINAPDDADISRLINQHMTLEGPLLPILHAFQERYGHIPDKAMAPIAATLNITKAELHGVISFYHDFREKPAGKHLIRICRGEACQSMGANRLAEEALSSLGLAWYETARNNEVTVEPVFCLGLCACAPAATVDGKLMGRVTAARISSTLKEAAQ